VEHSYRTEPGRCQACPFLVQCCGCQAEKGRLVP
jgi:hypothetical protein